MNDPKNDFNACNDFFTTVVESHIVAAVLQTLKMDKLDDMTTTHAIPDDANADEATAAILSIARDVALIIGVAVP